MVQRFPGPVRGFSGVGGQVLSPMSPADSMFLIAETREQPMHVGGLELFDPPEGSDGWDVLGLFRRLLHETSVSEPFRRRPRRGLSTGGLPGWVDDSDVDLEYHVRHSALPKPGRVLELLALVSRLHGTPLDRSRPLWEFHLIEGLADGRLAVYTKLHHSLMDGVTAMKLSEACLSADPDQPFVPPWVAPRGRPRPAVATTTAGSAVEKALGVGQTALKLAGNTASLLPTTANTVLRAVRAQAAPMSFSAPRTIFNTSITGSRRFAADSWPLERLRRVGKAADATLNDVVLTVCSGALRDYLVDNHALPDAPLIAMVPVSLRDDAGGRDGNAIGLTMCNLGTHLADPGDRLAAVHSSMLEGKQALAQMTPLQTLVMSALGMSPVALNLVFPLQDVARPPFNLIISNVPGPTKQLYLSGGRLDGFYPMSIPFQGQALNITCATYGHEIGFGLTGCRRQVPSLQRLLTHLDDAIGGLEHAVGVA